MKTIRELSELGPYDYCKQTLDDITIEYARHKDSFAVKVTKISTKESSSAFFNPLTSQIMFDAYKESGADLIFKPSEYDEVRNENF